VEYNLPSPWSFTAAQPEAWLRFDMCQNPPYDNCYVQTRVNIPDRPWNPIGGNSVNFTIFSSIDNCGSVLAANNPYSNSPTLADFLYTPPLGNAFYVHLVSGGSTELQGTFVVRITCDAIYKPVLNAHKEKAPAICPSNPIEMGLSYALGEIRTVPTSSDPSYWLQFKILNCLPPTHTTLVYTAQAQNTRSAISTLICKNGPCYEPNQFLHDKSGSSLNTISVPNYPNVPLYFSVSGWGAYNDVNTFTVAFAVE